MRVADDDANVVNAVRFISTTEASRAIRKKLKHGDTHQQLRALVVRAPQKSAREASVALTTPLLRS